MAPTMNHMGQPTTIQASVARSAYGTNPRPPPTVLTMQDVPTSGPQLAAYPGVTSSGAQLAFAADGGVAGARGNPDLWGEDVQMRISEKDVRLHPLVAASAASGAAAGRNHAGDAIVRQVKVLAGEDRSTAYLPRSYERGTASSTASVTEPTERHVPTLQARGGGRAAAVAKSKTGGGGGGGGGAKRRADPVRGSSSGNDDFLRHSTDADLFASSCDDLGAEAGAGRNENYDPSLSFSASNFIERSRLKPHQASSSPSSSSSSSSTSRHGGGGGGGTRPASAHTSSPSPSSSSTSYTRQDKGGQGRRAKEQSLVPLAASTVDVQSQISAVNMHSVVGDMAERLAAAEEAKGRLELERTALKERLENMTRQMKEMAKQSEV